MIDRGANPFVVDYSGDTKFDIFDLDQRVLLNLPTKKSIYFTTRPFEETTSFPDPWFYQTGVFDGKFDSLIGRGASGKILRGDWFGKKAAFKFVEIGIQKEQTFVDEGLKTLDEKLSEMISIQSTQGSKILKFYGHYR